ncbi:MAG: hypothetical protein Q8K64_11475 [Sediminibacterium sp.]|nr:hypothetical protein [Sediminibacterium sp.]
MESSIFIDSILKIAHWDKISITTINHSESLIYIPINNVNNNVGLVLIINTIKDEIEEGYLARINFTNKLLNQNSLSASIIDQFYKHKINTFSGNITGFDISNKFLWEMGYKNGDNIYKKKILHANKNQQKLLSNIKSNSTNDNIVKPTSCTAYFLVTYWSDGSIDYVYLGVTCTNTCEQTISINEKQENIIRSKCGGNSGSGNGGTPSMDKISSKLTDDCLKKIVDLILNSSISNSITNVLQNVFSINDKVNITFLQANEVIGNNGYPVPAHTTSDLIYVNGNMNHVVTLNSGMLNGSSQEYKAATIIHEIVHITLTVNAANSASAGIAPPSNYQHYLMLSSYMDEMSQSIKDFFPNLTVEQAKSLSLNGLGSVTTAPEFDGLIARWGFNNIPNDIQHWNYLNQRHEVGQEGYGTLCNNNRGVIGSELN